MPRQSLPNFPVFYLDKYCTCVLTFSVIVSHTSVRTLRSLYSGSRSYFGSHPSFIPEKINPFFSRTYELPILQPFCFYGLPSNGGGVPPLTLVFRMRYSLPARASGLSRYNRAMPVRLIALDIDGTLLDSRWQLPKANRAAIAEAARRGIEVALVTGRRYDFAMPVARQIDSPLTMIVNNGALIRSKDGQTHLRHLLSQDTALRVLELTRTWRDCTGVVFDRPRENQIILEALDSDDPIRSSYYSRNREFLAIDRKSTRLNSSHGYIS